MLRPQELDASRNAEALVQCAELEKKIDAALQRGYQGYGRSITYAWPSDMKRHVVEHVMAKYAAAGWGVRIVSEQRDGDYLEFTPYTPNACDDGGR